MLRVRDLARDLELPLLAGEDAAEAPIRWVHISELDDPTPWLSGGELLLTTGMGLAPAAAGAYVERLARHGLAGLGFGLGFGHDAVPPEVLAAARARDFPVFAVPYELPFIAVTERAFTQLVNEQYAVLRRAAAALDRLHRIVLDQRGLGAIAGALSTLVGAAVLVFDVRGEPLARHTFRTDLGDEQATRLAAELHDRARAGDVRAFAPHHGDLAGRALALPVAEAGEPARRNDSAPLPQAWLVAVKDAGGLDEYDRLVLHQAVTVVALELLRRRVADTTERRLAGDVLTALVGGGLAGDDLARRLEPFGLGGRATALVLHADGPPAAVERALEEALRDEAVSGLVARAGELACALLPGFLDDELFELGERVRGRAAGALGREVRGGAGRAVPAGDARRAFLEARCALEARALEGDRRGGTATFRDLGSFQLLLALQDDEALALFCDSLLGPLEQGEGHYGDELVRSLEAFIECNGQWEAAARRLPCHRHTLRYRMRKVEELTGRDLASARDRIEFWLALRGRELAA